MRFTLVTDSLATLNCIYFNEKKLLSESLIIKFYGVSFFFFLIILAINILKLFNKWTFDVGADI